MSKTVRSILFIVLLLSSFSYVHSARQIQLILKFDEAINLQTTKFIQPTCEKEEKISQTLSQLDEWVQITQSMESLKQYKQSLVDLVDMIEESRFYVEEKDIQQQTEEKSSSVSELQIGVTNIDFTLDQLTERLSRIENIQTYLQTLREEGFKDYDDYGKVLTSIRSFISDIDNLQSMEDELSMNRFKLIEKADEIQSIYNECYAKKKQNFIEQEAGSTNIFKLPESEQIIKPQMQIVKTDNQTEEKKVFDQELDQDSQNELLENVTESILKHDIEKDELLIAEDIVSDNKFEELPSFLGKDENFKIEGEQNQIEQEPIALDQQEKTNLVSGDDSIFLQTSSKHAKMHKLKKSKQLKRRYF